MSPENRSSSPETSKNVERNKICEVLGVAESATDEDLARAAEEMRDFEKRTNPGASFLDSLSPSQEKYLNSLINPHPKEAESVAEKGTEAGPCSREEVTNFLNIPQGSNDEQILIEHNILFVHNKNINYSQGDPIEKAPKGYEDFITNLASKYNFDLAA